MQITWLGAGDEDRLREVRLRALADSPQVFASTFERENAFTRDVWTSRLTSDTMVNLLAVDGGRAVGTTSARIEREAGTAQLLGMWVAPEARGHGVGRRLIETIVDWARERGIRRLALWVTEANEPARALYERSGFVPTGESQPLPSDASIMESRLVREIGRDLPAGRTHFRTTRTTPTSDCGSSSPSSSRCTS